MIGEAWKVYFVTLETSTTGTTAGTSTGTTAGTLEALLLALGLLLLLLFLLMVLSQWHTLEPLEGLSRLKPILAWQGPKIEWVVCHGGN